MLSIYLSIIIHNWRIVMQTLIPNPNSHFAYFAHYFFHLIPILSSHSYHISLLHNYKYRALVVHINCFCSPTLISHLNSQPYVMKPYNVIFALAKKSLKGFFYHQVFHINIRRNFLPFYHQVFVFRGY